VISLKKYLDMDSNELNKRREAGPEELLTLILALYRAALGAMGDCGVQACPVLGPDLQRCLLGLGRRLSRKAGPDGLMETEALVEEQLQQWGGRTSEYFQQRAGDVKEILLVLARAAEAGAERDQRYASQFVEFSKRLQAMANLEDLPQIRAAIVRGARDLKTCVDRMEQDSRESVAALRAQVSTYQTKVDEAEQQASRDALTGLENRYGLQMKIERRIADKKPFCLLLLDLQEFKQVNDTYGHPAGDDLLKQFGGELRSAARSSDVICRWGADEFIVVLDSSLAEAQSQLERMRKWIFGSYTLKVGTDTPKVNLEAALGLVEWQPGETMKELIKRVEAAMRRDKAAARNVPPPQPAGRPN